MVDSEINGLTELAETPASNDWLIIDDYSAIGGAPTPPATKKISVDYLLSFTDSLTQTLTNKTINFSNNTITNIVNANISASAAIDNSKLATNPLARTNHTGTQAFSTITGIVPLLQGGSGQTTAQTSINALTQVSGATDEHVLTKDTSTGNAIFKVISTGTTTLSGLTIDTNKDWLTYSVSNQFHEAVTMGSSSKTVTAESYVLRKLDIDSTGTLTISSGGSVEVI